MARPFLQVPSPPRSRATGARLLAFILLSLASREKRHSPLLSLSERAAIDEFVSRTRALLGAGLREVRLFGSRARGEGHEDSDVDIALIVADGTRQRRHDVYDLAFDVGLAHGIALAPLVLEESRLRQLRESERLLAIDLDADGIPL